MNIELSENFSGIKKMCVIDNPKCLSANAQDILETSYNILLDVECKQWKIENKRNPVSVDKE